MEEKQKRKSKLSLKTKSIYDPSEKSDGTRILVMTLWPRGFKKGSFDRWEKSLGTPLELIRKYKSGKIEWRALKKEYLKAMTGQKELLAEIAHLAKKKTATLLCACRDEATCHRSILKELIAIGPYPNGYYSLWAARSSLPRAKSRGRSGTQIQSRHPPSIRQTLEFGELPGRADLRQSAMPAGNRPYTTLLFLRFCAAKDAEFVCVSCPIQRYPCVVRRKLR